MCALLQSTWVEIGSHISVRHRWWKWRGNLWRHSTILYMTWYMQSKHTTILTDDLFLDPATIVTDLLHLEWIHPPILAPFFCCPYRNMGFFFGMDRWSHLVRFEPLSWLGYVCFKMSGASNSSGWIEWWFLTFDCLLLKFFRFHRFGCPYLLQLSPIWVRFGRRTPPTWQWNLAMMIQQRLQKL